ncbi:MAG: CotH kinase family protein [Bacteroidaceae bacterium]|nr:CotH kinase family protein [Bacteroidaceae bacterium]
MKRLTAFIVSLLSLPMLYAAKSWIDVTETYLVNPGFDNDLTTGWKWTSDAGSQKTGYGCMEFWNGTFDFYQTISGLPDGKYRLSVQGYHRAMDNQQGYSNYQQGLETISSVLYANEVTQPLVSVYSASLTENYAGGCWGTGTRFEYIYFPNTMQTASYCFSLGYYQNQLELDVTGGTLTIGLRNQDWVANNWCIFDNFKLEYYGEYVSVTDVTLSATSVELICGEVRQLKATVVPANATVRKLEWSSSDPSVVTCDGNGLLQALTEGTAVIRATATDGSGIYAQCNVKVGRREATSGTIVINELQAANIDMFVDPSFNYGTWIELYNPTDLAVSLNNCYVSDDPSDLKKYPLRQYGGAVPARGFHTLWFDHYSQWAPSQIDAKLDCEGGTIYLSNSSGELICSQEYPAAIGRTSYARTADGGSEWGVTANPTPGKSNAASRFAGTRLEAPVVDKDACLFTSPFTVQVEIPSGATLRYTTDGTTPTEQNGAVSADGRFTVESTTIYRFRLFAEGSLPSTVVTRSYLYQDKEYTLPVVSVVTDPVNLYDDSLGIYVRGVNGRPGNGQSSPCNWNMDWDRPVNFEYITPEGEMVINQEANMEMCGGWSRAWTPHSFKIKANKVYEGLNYIPYPVFTEKPHLKHKTLQIRNGGNDTGSRIKDAALQAVVHSSGLDIDGQACQPVVHFINGEYIGLLNVREPNNKHFVEANYGWDEEEIDQFEMSPDSGYCQKCGTDEAFLQWYTLSATADNAATYEEICNLVDIDEYINYMAVEMYLGGTDWPQNNVKGFRPRWDGGKFRFVLFDLDGTFATTSPFTTFEGKQIYEFDYLYGQDTHYITEEIKFVTIFLNMLQNETFRKQFIDTYCLVTGSVFTPGRSEQIITEMAQRTEAMLAYEYKSPWGTANSLISSLHNRQQTMINALKGYSRMELSSTASTAVKFSANLPEARLTLNGLPVPTNAFDGILFAPATLKAEAPAGYRFAGWATENGGNAVSLLAAGAAWNYYDQGSLDASDWTAVSFDDSSWGDGQAPLGYYTGDSGNGRGYNTFLDYGDDASAKRPTYYFRTEVQLSHTPLSSDVYTLSYTVDDGMIVYVNGQEAARYQMPSGTVGFDTYASTYANGNPDSGTLTLPASLFKKGSNLIAVEVHNNNASSTDIYFDASLSVTTSSVTGQTNYLCTTEEYELPFDGSVTSLVACYEPLSGEALAGIPSLPVRINEVSADNSIYINEFYKKNDWIELYNTTDEPIDVAGMYISDNAQKPEKYQIPASDAVNTVIPAHGYLILWADKLEAVSQLHTTFKLDADGGDVLLSAADGSWKDQLSYPLHSGEESVGLYPDGGTSIYLMNTPTFGRSNRLSASYALYIEESPDGVGTLEADGGDGTSLLISCRDRQLEILGTAVAGVSLYNLAGQLCLTPQPASVISLPASLATGVYIVKVTDATGGIYTAKIAVR